VIEAEIADLMSKAGGAAAVEIITARRQRWEMHMDARARAEQHAGEIANYEAAPSVYIARKYFDALQELIKDKRVYIVNDDSDGLEVRVDLHDAAIGGNLFENPTANQQNP
jgi:hypothetical protein